MENFDNNVSRIIVGSQDEKIINQDARVVYVSKGENEIKRTGDFMLGNDHKSLKEGEYISDEEYLEAANELFHQTGAKKIKMVKTGKKIPPEKLKKEIERSKKAAKITLTPNSKIINQDARLVSVDTKEMYKEEVVSGMFLGKNGPDLANGDYVFREDVEFNIIERKKPQVPPKPGEIRTKTLKGLGTVAVIAGLVALIPFIMHANSVMWHHSAPEIQNILHSINLGLGKLVNYSYEAHSGLWTTLSGEFMNIDAPTASILPSLLTYGLTAAGITKLVNDIKNGIVTVKEKIEGGKTL